MSLKRIAEAVYDEHGMIEAPRYRCHCGYRIEAWYPMDNECGQCGRNFNANGQEVKLMADCFDHDDYEGEPE